MTEAYQQTLVVLTLAFLGAKNDDEAIARKNDPASIGSELMRELALLPQEDMFPRAIVRLIIDDNKWLMHPDFDAVLMKFFGPDAEPKLKAADYLRLTDALLKKWFNRTIDLEETVKKRSRNYEPAP